MVKVHILASAHTLLGNNYYAAQTAELDTQKEHSDLLDRIEEYFYRIQKLTLSGNYRGNELTVKYLARIVTDMVLLTKDISYEDMHQLHYSDILDNAVSKTQIFSDTQKQVLHSYFQNETKSKQNTFEVIDTLHQVFTHLLTTHYEKYTHNS